MSEFTEKLRSSELVWNAVNEVDKDQADVGFLIEIIRNEFKDWQPPKPREIPVEIPVEIPQFVAGWFEEKMSVAFSEVVSAYCFSDDEDIKWVRDNGGLDLLCKMKLYGYTVEKEQLYEVVFSKCQDGDRYLLFANIEFFIGIESMNDGYYRQQFTEAEIKAIDKRYWAFRKEVEI